MEEGLETDAGDKFVIQPKCHDYDGGDDGGGDDDGDEEEAGLAVLFVSLFVLLLQNISSAFQMER